MRTLLKGWELNKGSDKRYCITCGIEFDPLWEGNLSETLCHNCDDEANEAAGLYDEMTK